MIFTNVSCQNPEIEEMPQTTLKPYSPQEMENAVIYEVNIRQYSKEGTFEAFIKDIPELKKLGVKVLWVMPIQPISIKRRKATDSQAIEDIKDPEEKKKYLGSYYAITDYTAIHPDYGTLENFKNLVKTAHENGMYVILDWVANHTGWDHKWIEEHPEYFEKNSKGEVTDPLNPSTGQPWGWTDVAHLKYDKSTGIYDAMSDEMLFWIKETNLDGFRCDVADNVKLDFWEYVYPKLNELKPVFMLMESDSPEYLKNIFDMGYGWKIHHVLNKIAKGHQSVWDFDNTMKEIDSLYRDGGYMMNFTSNHDENSWHGTEFERLGNAVETFAALTYVMPGMPLIYNGQEYNSHQRLKFFEKDTIERTKGEMFEVYEKLGRLKKENPALHGAVNPASYKRIPTSDDHRMLAFRREKEGHKVYYIGNFSNTYKKFHIPLGGTYQNYMTGEKIELDVHQELEFSPWQYWILIP